jgi:glycine/D-amino acid oxidase-like deaminating enzyme
MDVGNSDDTSLNPKVSQALRSYLPERFPKDFGTPEARKELKVEMEWAGIMGWSADGMPMVGELKDSAGLKDEFVLAGYCGHGMPRIFLSGRAVAEMVAGVGVSAGFPSVFEPRLERMRLVSEDFTSKL